MSVRAGTHASRTAVRRYGLMPVKPPQKPVHRLRHESPRRSSGRTARICLAPQPGLALCPHHAKPVAIHRFRAVAARRLEPGSRDPVGRTGPARDGGSIVDRGRGAGPSGLVGLHDPVATPPRRGHRSAGAACHGVCAGSGRSTHRRGDRLDAGDRACAGAPCPAALAGGNDGAARARAAPRPSFRGRGMARHGTGRRVPGGSAAGSRRRVRPGGRDACRPGPAG